MRVEGESLARGWGPGGGGGLWSLEALALEVASGKGDSACLPGPKEVKLSPIRLTKMAFLEAYEMGLKAIL